MYVKIQGKGENPVKNQVKNVKSKTVSTNNHAVCVRDEYLVDNRLQFLCDGIENMQKYCMAESNIDMQSTTHKLTQMYNAITLPSMRNL